MPKQIAITGYVIAGKPDPRMKANMGMPMGFAYPISIQKVRRSYRVVYGVAVRDELHYDDACKELGRAIMHALQCDGVFDERD